MTTTPKGARITAPPDVLCAVCRLRHDNIAYSPETWDRLLWCCIECLNTKIDDISIVRKVYGMPKKTLDVYERRAIATGGEKAGEYLDEIGRTDLAELAPHEFIQFGTRWLLGYAEAIREDIGSGRAPF